METTEYETPNSLFKGILKMARESGEFKEIDEIFDHALAYWDREEFMQPITNCEFGTSFEVNVNGPEGVWIDAYIIDPFERPARKHKRLHFGALEALVDRSLHNIKIMGQACGILQYFSREYWYKNSEKLEEQEEALKKTHK